MKKHFLITILFLSVLLPVAAQKPRVTVIPFNSIGLSKSDAQSLTILFEASLQNTGAFTLIEQVEAVNILEAQEYSLSVCVDELCAIEIGRLLSADQIVLGTVGKVVNLYYMTVKLIDVQTGQKLIAKKEQDESLSELVRKFDSVARLLAGEEGAGSDSNKVVQLELPEGRYEGTVKDGKPHGRGTLHFADDNEYHRETYEGTFKEGVIHGFGTMTWANGDRYEGEYRDGKRTGQGIFYYANGNRYVGEVRDGKYNGQGTYYYSDTGPYAGDRYEGEYRDDKSNGQGTYYHANGDRFEGEYRDDKRNGQGTYYYSDTGPYAGDRYEGEYRDDKSNGQGTYYSKNGDVYTGKWAKDLPIGGWLSGPNRAREWVTDWWD
ncbi:MAG TPA: hypothetical protein ENI27_01770 [bacterium]|nr:hypothetical protein [bacterium]